MKRDWSKVKCDVNQRFGELYQRSGAENILEKLETFSMRTTSVFRSKENSMQVDSIYESLIHDLKAIKEKQNLSACQAACMVACTTSKLAVYNDSGRAWKNDEEDPAVNILINGTGVCRHYAIVATDLAAGIGLHAKNATSISGNHAFLGVEVDGRWAYIEPQLDSCKFYELDGQASGATVGSNKRMWFEDSDKTPALPLAYVPQSGTSAQNSIVATGETSRVGDATSEGSSPAPKSQPSRSIGGWMSDQALSLSTDAPIPLIGSYVIDRYGMTLGSNTTGKIERNSESMLGARFGARIVDAQSGRPVGSVSVVGATGALSIDGSVSALQYMPWTQETGDGGFYSALIRPANAEFQLSTDGANSVVIAPEAALAYKNRGDFITSDVEMRFSPLVFGIVPTIGSGNPAPALGQNSMFASKIAIDGSTQFAINDVEHLELSMGVEKLIDLNRSMRLPDTFALRGSIVYARNTQKGGSWYLGVVGEERPMMNSAFTGITFGIRPPH